MKKKKNEGISEDVVKALHKANREIEMERNGFRWVAVNRPHKNKKKYDRKENKKELRNNLNSYFFYRGITSKDNG